MKYKGSAWSMNNEGLSKITAARSRAQPYLVGHCYSKHNNNKIRCAQITSDSLH